MKDGNVESVRPVLDQRRRLVRILVEDPDLGHRLDPDEVSEATRQTVGILEEVSPGPWRPASVTDGKCLFGGLVLDGLLVRELTVAGVVTAELMGAGDIVLPSDTDLPVPFVTVDMTWTALEPARVAWLDGPFVVAIRRWPQLGAAVLERTRRRIVRVGVLQAIGQMTRIDDRVLTLLWHLAERWGRVRRDGILLPLRLPHKAIARLIGARRPSVTTAIGSLERQGLIERFADGAWLLIGPPPHTLAKLSSVDSPWTHARTGDPAVTEVTIDQDRPHPPVTDGASAQHVRAEDAVARARLLRDGSQSLTARVRDERDNR